MACDDSNHLSRCVAQHHGPRLFQHDTSRASFENTQRDSIKDICIPFGRSTGTLAGCRRINRLHLSARSHRHHRRSRLASNAPRIHDQPIGETCRRSDDAAHLRTHRAGRTGRPQCRQLPATAGSTAELRRTSSGSSEPLRPSALRWKTRERCWLTNPAQSKMRSYVGPDRRPAGRCRGTAERPPSRSQRPDVGAGAVPPAEENRLLPCRLGTTFSKLITRRW